MRAELNRNRTISIKAESVAEEIVIQDIIDRGAVKIVHPNRNSGQINLSFFEESEDTE